MVPIGVTHISLPLHQIPSREREEREQTNKTLGVNSSAEGDLCNIVPMCSCRLTLAWILAKLPQSNWNADSSWFDLLHCRWTISPADWSLRSVSGVDCLSPSSLANCPLRAPLSSSLLASPYHLRSSQDLKSKTLCLVSRQIRQRNRLLGGPPTQCYNTTVKKWSFTEIWVTASFL